MKEKMMNKNEKGNAANIAGLINLGNKPTVYNNTTTQYRFQYKCNFCWRELPNGSTRFAGFGACPRCYWLAHRFVDILRGHRANYFNNLGVRK
jgi:hypothetical protein